MAALVSIIPILLLFVLMMGLKMSGWKSALITLVVTVVLAIFAAPALGIIPEKYAETSIVGITFWSIIEGFLKACFPIILIVICAIFSYNILCETKEIETIKTQFTQLTSDKGLLVSGWCAGRNGWIRYSRSHPSSHSHRTGIQAYVLCRNLSGGQYRSRGIRCRRSACHHPGQ